jgi:hypothetical protein
MKRVEITETKVYLFDDERCIRDADAWGVDMTRYPDKDAYLQESFFELRTSGDTDHIDGTIIRLESQDVDVDWWEAADE